MGDETPIEEIVSRRFGADHEKPCAEPEIRTCALWNCQIANQCQMLPRQPARRFKFTRTQRAARDAAEKRHAREAAIDHVRNGGQFRPAPYVGRVINPACNPSATADSPLAGVTPNPPPSVSSVSAVSETVDDEVADWNGNGN